LDRPRGDRRLHHEHDHGGSEGVIATIILGIVGAVVGGYLAGTVLGVADVTGVNVESIVVAVIGGVVLVAAYRLLMGQRNAQV